MRLPVGDHLKEEPRVAQLTTDEKVTVLHRIMAAKNLAFVRRDKAGYKVDIQCLTLGDARVLHMPGELVVEYQLAAKEMRPDLFVAMAAYADYAAGYICLAKHYDEGGYEASPRASRVSPKVESVLMAAMEKLLGQPR